MKDRAAHVYNKHIPRVSASTLDDCSGGTCVNGRLLASAKASHITQGSASRNCDRDNSRMGTKSSNDRGGGPCPHSCLFT